MSNPVIEAPALTPAALLRAEAANTTNIGQLGACDRCRLSAGGCKTVGLWGKGATGGVMIVGDSPSFDDDQNAALYSSKKDRLIADVLQQGLNVDTSQVYLTYLTKCRAPDGRKTTLTEASLCYAYLLEEIERVKPRVILTLGETVLNVVVGETGIVRRRGDLVKVTFDCPSGPLTLPVVPTVAPGYVAYNEGAFYNFAKDLERAWLIASGAKVESVVSRVYLMQRPEEVETLIAYIRATGICSFDFETNGKPPYGPEFAPTLLSVSFQQGSAWVITLEHTETVFTPAEQAWIMDRLAEEVFNDPEIEKVAHNFKFDAACWTYYRVRRIRGRWSDTMVMHHLLNENEYNGLKPIVEQVFPTFAGYDAEVKQYKWDAVPLRVLAPYAGTDSDLTLRLRFHYEAELLQDPQLYRVYRNLQMAAIRTLFDAEREGLAVDVPFLEQAIRDTEKIQERQLEKLLGHPTVKKFQLRERERLTVLAMQELEEKRAQEVAALAVTRERKLAELRADVEETQGREQTALDEGKKFGKASQTRLDRLEHELANYPAKLTSPRLQQIDAAIRAYKTGSGAAVYDGINFGSWQQLGDLLYTSPAGYRFPLPYVKKKRDFAVSTDRDTLEQLKDKSGFVDDLLIYRTINKMLSTYMRGMLDKLDRNDHIHTSFLQHGTVTGRLSSREPNLQNIPRAAKLKNPLAIEVVDKIKSMFKAPTGYTFVQVDYSQAELRIAAEFANERVMLQAYAEDKDLHLVTALNINKLTEAAFNALPGKESKELRSRAKPANFGLIYDVSVEGFIDYARKGYGIVLTLKEAEVIYSGFFKLYPNLKLWHKTSVKSAELNGFVRTLFGRKRRLLEIHNPDPYLKAFDDRAAINAPVQGTGGEFTIFAMALLRDRLDPRIKIVLNVHDSICFYVPDDLVDDALPLIVDTCEDLPTEDYFKASLKKVRMKVDAEVSKANWKEVKPYEWPE